MYCSIYPVIGKQTELPFYISGIGISEPEYHIKRENGLSSHQFLFVKRGTGVFRCNGECYDIKEGDMLYMAKGVPHEYFPIDESFTTCWTVFRGEHLSLLMKALGFGDYGIAKNAIGDTVSSIFNMLLSAAGETVCDAEKCSKILYEYILEVKRLFCEDNQPKDYTKKAAEDAALYICENFSKDITLEELSTMAGISKQHFDRIFRQKFGLRPMEYIALKRISYAKTLLESTDKKIAEIGILAGYPDPTYFGMVFKKYEGVAPKAYRDMHGNR